MQSAWGRVHELETNTDTNKGSLRIYVRGVRTFLGGTFLDLRSGGHLFFMSRQGGTYFYPLSRGARFLFGDVLTVFHPVHMFVVFSSHFILSACMEISLTMFHPVRLLGSALTVFILSGMQVG